MATTSETAILAGFTDEDPGDRPGERRHWLPSGSHGLKVSVRGHATLLDADGRAASDLVADDAASLRHLLTQRIDYRGWRDVRNTFREAVWIDGAGWE